MKGQINCKSIFLCNSGTPLPGYGNDSKNSVSDGVSMSYESAQKRFLAGKKLMDNLPSWLMTELVQLGVIYFSEEKQRNDGNKNLNGRNEVETGKDIAMGGSVQESAKEIIILKGNDVEKEKEKILGLNGYGFRDNIRRSIKQAFHLYEYLKIQIEVANDFNKSLGTVLESYKNSKESKEKNIFYVKEFYKSMWKLVILPPSHLRKSLDKILVGESVVQLHDYSTEDEDKDNIDVDDKELLPIC